MNRLPSHPRAGRPLRPAGKQAPAPPIAAEPPLHHTHLAMYRRLATVFILLTLAVAALVFYVVWSKATVIVLSRQAEVRAEFIADISPEPTGGELTGGLLEITDSLTKEFTTATVSKMDTYAEGRVRITSGLSRPQTLVATTRLLTPEGILFRLKDRIIVPPLGSVQADVFSDGTGEEMNVGQTTFIIPGLNPALQSKFRVETVGAIDGGVKDIRLVTEQNYEKAVSDLQAELTAKLQADLAEQALEAGWPTDGQVVESFVLDKESDPAVGQEADKYSVTVEVKASGVFYDKPALTRLAEMRVKEIIPLGKALYEMHDDSTVVTVEKADRLGGRANLRVAASGTAVLSDEAPALHPTKLTGVSSKAAVSYLEQIDGVASASVKVSPFWSKRLPTVPGNITVEVR